MNPLEKVLNTFNLSFCQLQPLPQQCVWHVRFAHCSFMNSFKSKVSPYVDVISMIGSFSSGLMYQSFLSIYCWKSHAHLTPEVGCSKLIFKMRHKII